MSNRRTLLWMALALAVGFGGIFGFIGFRQMMIARYMANYRPPPVTVAVEAARGERWDHALATVGALKATAGVDIATETAGIVSAVLFKPGDAVTGGQELLRLDDRVEVATLKSLEAQRRLAEINFERDQRLLKSRAISRTDFDKTEAQLKDVSAQVEKTQALIGRKHVRAPFAGRIGIALVETGQYVQKGDPLVTLQATDVLEVEFALPELQVPLIRIGQPLRFTVHAFPGREFTGVLTAIDAKVIGTTRNVRLRARVTQGDPTLLPGMFVSVQLVVEQDVPVVSVPETAISYNLYGDSVFVVKDQPVTDGVARKIVERRYVQTGDSREGRVALLKGLAAGEPVVVAGGLKLDAGAEVKLERRADTAP